jgi:hypothetical protein
MSWHLLNIDGVRLAVARRRYGTRTFTWLSYADGHDWQSYGDPWPSVRIPRAQLEIAVREIKGKLARRNVWDVDALRLKLAEVCIEESGAA